MWKRSISVTELQKIKENLNQMRRLCEAATAHGGENALLEAGTKAIDNILSKVKCVVLIKCTLET